MWQMDWFEPLARNALIAFVQQAFGLAKRSTGLRIRWSPKSGASIEGKVEVLHSIRHALQGIAQRKRGNARFSSATEGSPAPYEEFLDGIRIEFRPGLFQASVTPKRWLLFTGDDQSLHHAASYFTFPESDTPSMHHHLEAGEWTDWIKSESEPLVIEVVPV
jgi:hypothetical protein